MPVVPPAPATFSMTICWPSDAGHVVGDDAGDDVGRSARREGHDHGDRPLRIGALGLGRRTRRGRGRRQGEGPVTSSTLPPVCTPRSPAAALTRQQDRNRPRPLIDFSPTRRTPRPGPGGSPAAAPARGGRRATARRPALTGRSRKVMRSPRDRISARRRFSSISLPSTKPSSIGAGSKPSLIST